MADFAHDDHDNRLYLDEWMTALVIKNVTVAKDLGVSESAVSNWRTGTKRLASLGKAREIASSLGVPIDTLYLPPPPKEAFEVAAQLRNAGLAAMAYRLHSPQPQALTSVAKGPKARRRT